MFGCMGAFSEVSWQALLAPLPPFIEQLPPLQHPLPPPFPVACRTQGGHEICCENERNERNAQPRNKLQCTHLAVNPLASTDQKSQHHDSSNKSKLFACCCLLRTTGCCSGSGSLERVEDAFLEGGSSTRLRAVLRRTPTNLKF